jgi:hypothetical protein
MLDLSASRQAQARRLADVLAGHDEARVSQQSEPMQHLLRRQQAAGR